MPEAKFTPGPWRADWDDNGQWYVEPLQVTGPYLRGDSGDCVESANAHLIASAPDLYAALEINQVALAQAHGAMSAARPSLHLNYVDMCDCHTGQAYRTTLAALAKARGEVSPT